MISEAELLRHAVAAGVDTLVQDLDDGLGWFLAGLFSANARGAVPGLQGR